MAPPLIQPTQRSTSANSGRRHSALARGNRGSFSARSQGRGQRSIVSTRGATAGNCSETGRRGTCPGGEAPAAEQPITTSPSQELQRRLRRHEEEIARLREQLYDSTRECDRLRDRAAAAELLLANGASCSTMPEDVAATLLPGPGCDQDDSAESEVHPEKTTIAVYEAQSLGSSLGEAAAVPSSSADCSVHGSSARVAPMRSGAVYFCSGRTSSVVRSTSAPPLQERRSVSPRLIQAAGGLSPPRAGHQLQPHPQTAEPAVSVAVKTAARRPGTFVPSVRATLPVRYQHKSEHEGLLLTVRSVAQQGPVQTAVVQQTMARECTVMATGQQQSSAHQPLTQPKAGQQTMMQQQIVQQTGQPVTQMKSQPAPQPMPAHSMVQSVAPPIPQLKANGSPLPTLHALLISPRNSTKAPCGVSRENTNNAQTPVTCFKAPQILVESAAVGKGLVFKMSESPTASPNIMQFRYTPDMEMVSAFGNASAGPIAACAATAPARTRPGDTPLSGLRG